MQTDISDVLNKLKSLSDSTDLIIYQHTRGNERIHKWLTTIKETANAIINNKTFPKSSGTKAKEFPVIPDLLSENEEKLQTKRNRVSSFLAAAQKDHARLSHRKSRSSVRKLVLEKKNGNQWEISHSKSSDDQKSPKSFDCKGVSPNVKNKSSKSSTNICPRASRVGIKTSANIKDENSYSTPQSHLTEVLVPNSDEKTPVTRSKTRDIVNINPVATLKKQRPLSSNKKYCNQELTPDIIQKKTTKKCVPSDAQSLKLDDPKLTVSDQSCKIGNSGNSSAQIETIILDSSDSGESLESKARTRSKRKSSIQLVQEKAKKTKNSSSESQVVKHAKLLHDDNASGSKYSKRLRLNKNAVIQPKTSGTSFQQINAGSEKRILREIQKKEEVVSQNTKKLKTLRQMKIDESKKMREIKMEKAMQQRLKIESEKKERMKCRTVSKQENVLQKELSVKKTALRKLLAEEKADSVKKATPTSSQKVNVQTTLKALQNEKVTSSTPKKAPPKPVRTPVKKATEQTEAKLVNQTFTNPSAEAVPSSKEVFTKPSPLNSTYVAKAVTVTSTPASKKTVTKMSKTPVSTLKKNSYAMTPSESSFVSYDVSEIKSDDSDEEESSNNKPIPSWASGVRLRNALLNQQYNTIDTAELFGNYFETPNLTTIMGVEKKQYFKRTSSAIWINSPNRSILY